MANAPNPGLEDRLTITVDEAARLLGISRGAAYEAVRAGAIPTLRIGRRLLVLTTPLRLLLRTDETPEAMDQA